MEDKTLDRETEKYAIRKQARFGIPSFSTSRRTEGKAAYWEAVKHPSLGVSGP